MATEHRPASIDFATRLALIQSSESLDAAILALDSTSDREVMRRLALPHAFDRALAMDVLLSSELGVPAAAGALTFETILEDPSVEPVPRLRNHYRVRPDARAPLLKEWEDSSLTERQSDLADRAVTCVLLHRRLADYFQALGPKWADEWLYHLLACEPGEGKPLFERLYADAQESGDMARCYNLLGVVEERAQDLGSWAELQRNTKMPHLRVRTASSEDHYLTSRYFERRVLRNAFDALIDGSAHWILELCGMGGMGKTFFLRWAVARHCVPRHIPVARIDFDFYPVTQASDEPWLLLGRLAEALSGQISSPSLSALASELREHRRIHEWNLNSANASPWLGALPRAEVMDDSLLERFAAALEDGPILLILDTLEVARAAHLIDAPTILRSLSRIHDLNPNVRLIIAGRFPLAPELAKDDPELGRWFARDRFPVDLEKLDAAEAEEFLRVGRRIDDDDVIGAMVDMADGLPFSLAMLADLWAANRALTASEIRSHKSVGLLYLLERVVKRIPQYEVRWLLRYGVVPRKLTRSLLAEVMEPYLRRAMSGERTFDDPVLDEVDSATADDPMWRRDRTPPPADVMWDELVKYAGASSWVMWSKDEPDALVFHPAVARPMRDVLRTQSVVHMLHDACIRYFERLADTDPMRRAHWWSEVMYHRRQRDPADAGRHWQWMMSSVEADAALRQTLALDAVRAAPDQGEGGRAADTALPLAAPIRMRAQFELARASVELASLARPAGRARLMAEAAGALANMRELAQGARPPGVLPEQVALVEARVVGASDPERALSIARAALATVTDAPVAMELEALSGDLAFGRNDPSGADHYRAAAHHAMQTGARERESALREQLARYEAEHDRIESAIAETIAAARLARVSNPARYPTLRIMLATLQVRSGMPSRALLTLKETEYRTPMPEAAAHRIRETFVQARALLELRAPVRAGEALIPCDRMIAMLRRTASDEEANRQCGELDAERHELFGRVYGTLLEYGPALDALDTARGMWRTMGGIEHANRCLQRQIELQLRDIGNLRHAERLLEQADRTSLPALDESNVYFSSLRAEWLDRKGDGKGARDLLDDTIAEIADAWRPRVLARLALDGLARQHKRTRIDYLEQLALALEACDSVPARLALLAPLARCPRVPKVPPELAARLHALVDLSTHSQGRDRRVEHPDDLLLGIRLVELDRVIGASAKAKLRLRKISERLPGFVFGARELFRARERLGVVGEADTSDEAVSTFHELLKNYAGLRGTFLLEEAEAYVSIGAPEIVSAKVWQAAPLLECSESLQTVWQARLAEMQARLAELAGHESRINYLIKARDLYDQLGDDSQRKRIASLIAALADEALAAGRRETVANEPSFGTRDRWTVGVLVRSGDCSVSIELPEGSSSKAPPPRPLPEALAWSSAPWTEFGSRRAIGPLGGSFTAAVSYLSRLLLMNNGIPVESLVPWDVLTGAVRQKKGRGHEAHLRLELDQPALQAIPWEILLSHSGQPVVLSGAFRYVYRSASHTVAQRERVRFAQRALTALGFDSLLCDGIWGVATQHAIARYQRSRELRRTGKPDPATFSALRADLRAKRRQRLAVTIVQPSAARDERAYRSSHARGLAAEVFYRRHGFDVDILEDPEPEQLERRIRAHRPAVLHFAAAFEESPTLGSVVLDFAGGARGGAASLSLERTPIIPATIDRIMQRMPDELAHPFVVCDVPPQTTALDTARQLVLRNAFAGELFLLGNTQITLAMGLVGTHELEHRTVVYDTLVGGLAYGARAGEIAWSLRTLAPPRYANTGSSSAFESRVSTLGVALFAHDPELTRISMRT